MKSNRPAALALAATSVTFPFATVARADVSQAPPVAHHRGSVCWDECTWQWRYRLVVVIRGMSAGAARSISRPTYGPWSEWHSGPVKLPMIAQPRNGYARYQIQKARMPAL